MVHFIYLLKYPSIKQTWDVMLYHNFCFYAFHRNMTSHLCCQFVSRFGAILLSVSFQLNQEVETMLSNGQEPRVLEQASRFALPLVSHFYSLPLAINPPLT